MPCISSRNTLLGHLELLYIRRSRGSHALVVYYKLKTIKGIIANVMVLTIDALYLPIYLYQSCHKMQHHQIPPTTTHHPPTTGLPSSRSIGPSLQHLITTMDLDLLSALMVKSKITLKIRGFHLIKSFLHGRQDTTAASH